ncbi:MAG: sigma-70 family RNA polymerase sigma factor [Planctomycetota bacterium]|jgi:RNA polymerase sigma-70 factor (ECF subfamily)
MTAGDRHGDQVELVRLLSRHQRAIYAYAHSILHDFHLAEDVYQEVAVIVAGTWPGIPPEEAVKPWLMEITRRKALEARRKSRRLSRVLPSNVLEQVEGEFARETAEDDGRQDLRDSLAACMAKLSELARQVIQARYGAGLSCQDIAGKLSRSVQSIYAILKRSRLSLAECVERRRAAGASGA